MSAIADEYERWMREGNRDFREFLSGRELSEDDFREVLFTDQFVRHQADNPLDVARYAEQLSRVADDRELQIDLWIEAFGYREESGEITASARQRFLAEVPELIRDAVAEQAVCEIAQSLTSPWDSPPVVPRYRIDEELGRGAFGVVYRAWDNQLDRAVALKVIQQSQRSDDLFAEARMVAKLDVPGIVSVYDCGIEAGGRSFFVTSFLDGPDLQQWSDSIQPDDWKRVCRTFIRLCESLKAAHASGIVHRDIKPTNIIVRESDDPCLLDFGLALGQWKPGREGELVGTPAYMSPEQARGEGHLVDARSDIFSVGILLFESLTHKRPWDSKSSRELVREIAHGQVRPVRRINSAVPIALEQICSKATAATIAGRYSEISELIDDLQWFVDDAEPDSSERSSRSTGIASRGLRPYTADDAEAFWQLVPGQRNAKGVPDTVRWWRDSIEGSTTLGPRRGALVLYGPSGSGKSSLLHAGVLPFIDTHNTRCISVDASELNEPDSMMRHLASASGVETGNASTLAGLCRRLRDNDALRTVIVLDQFEHVLAWADEQHRKDFTMAMRQADGCHLQFVLVVRDEFWSAVSQLMRDVDAPLRDGRNAMGLERFSREHAASVLQTWADAAGNHAVTDAFIDRALGLIAESNRVIPVRLALLVSILGDAAWTLQRLDKIQAQGSLSGYYLDSVLGELAPAARQRFTQPAREMLRCLTPDSGRIRGTARSADQLRQACGSAGRPPTDAEFDDLVDLLDRQLHLITPTEDSSSTSTHYQLPHDFLVTEIRDWLDASDLKTTRGRASVDLRRATGRWSNDSHARNLAGPIDCLRFGLITRPSGSGQRAFVKASARKHLLRGVAVASIAAMLVATFQFVMLRSNGSALVSRLVSSNVDRLPELIAETRRLQTWTHRPLASRLSIAEKDADLAAKDRISLALLHDDPSRSNYLSQRLVEVDARTRTVILQQMILDLDAGDRKAVTDRLAGIVSDESESGTTRLRAAVGIGWLNPKHSSWDLVGDDVCQMLVDANPMDLGWLKDGLYPIRSHLRPGLTAIRTDEDPARVRTATYLLAEFAADDLNALVDLLENSSLTQLSAVAPAVSEADQDIVKLLQERFAERLNAWTTARETIDASEEEPRSLNRRAAISSLQVTLSRKIGNLGAALIWRGADRGLVKHLRFSKEPTIRSYLIECYASSQGPATPLVDLLLDSSGGHARVHEDLSPDIAAALLQAIGSLPASSQVPKAIRNLSVELYRNSDNAELQASAEWFLSKHGYEADLAGLVPVESTGYRTSQEHMMVRLPGDLTAMVGSSLLDRNRLANEDQHEIQIPKEVYFSRHEISVVQLQRFRETQDTAMAPVARKDGDNAAMRLGFFEAAAYCNWLSEQEGIDENQWCYLPNEDNQFAPGMQIAENHLQRSGYQIPTPDLWEYACRGGTTTPRPYGYGTELSSGYVRWMGTRPGTRSRVSIRKPNGFGLFDMLGNSSEWSVGLVDRKQMNTPGPRNRGPETRFRSDGPGPRRRGPGMERPGFGPPLDRGDGSGERVPGRIGLAFGGGPRLIEAGGETVRENSQFAILGGAFDSPAHKVRSSDRSIISPPFTNKPVTLRLMRIVAW